MDKRYSKFGVGKYIGGKVYLHKQYEELLPDNLLENAKLRLFDHLGGVFDYNIVSYNTKNSAITFTVSPDFDKSDEPIIGQQYVVYTDGSVFAVHLQTKNPYIYHHKWLFVKDDYTGFNVEASIRRSKQWLALAGVDMKRIGKREFWENNVLPRLDQSF